MHFYIIKLDSLIKYGIFNDNNYGRLIDGQTYCSREIECLKLFIIEQNDNYRLNIKDYDKIYSSFIRFNKINELEELYDIELPLMKDLYNGLIKEEYGGTELLDLDYSDIFIETIYNELTQLGLDIIKEYTHEEINKIMKSIRINNYNIDTIENNNNIRGYQKEIINYIYKKLLDINKLYLELATGAGKSFITFQILKLIKPDIIVIFSPRTSINKQNIDDKYLELLNDDYIPINFSDNKKIEGDKLIISCCYQSKHKLYELIKDYSNIFVWFDEAHWSVEETWLDSESESVNYWLYSNNIQYRLFTSASPNRDIVINNKNTFGELYKPILVKDLITDKWLCPINPYIFETEENNNVNICNYIINNFSKLDKNYGISFHNRTENAYKLFKLHYKQYIIGDTIIKPFLFVSDNSNINKKINKIQVSGNLDYNFLDLDVFMNSNKSIIYSVKRLDMGWDFSELDFICFSDAKMSHKDIIQCIGRGTRSDKLELDGRNKYKKLDILLPIFVSGYELNDYTKIINVLKYLTYDIGLDIKRSIINKNSINKNNTNKSVVNYEGTDEKSAIILNLLNFKMSLKELNRILIDNKIYNDENYYIFKDNNRHLKLRDSVYEYEGFKWKSIVDNDGLKYYNTLQECYDAKNILLNDKMIKNKIKKYGWEKLNKYDNKIPPYNKLKEYYY